MVKKIGAVFLFVFGLLFSAGICPAVETPVQKKPELVSNADLAKIDAYGLPEGFKYVFEADKSGAKPDVEITLDSGPSVGQKSLKIFSKNGKGRVFVRLPADLSGQPATGKRYFLVRWQVKTAGEGRVYLGINRGIGSQSVQSERWITAVVPIEPLSPVSELGLTFSAQNSGDACWLGLVSVTGLNQPEYKKCFINTKWPVVPDEKVSGLPRTTRAGKAGNILANSSFELGPYSGRQPIMSQLVKGNTDRGLGAENSHDGRYCCQAVRFESIYYPFQPDKLYTVSVYARSAKPGAVLRLGVRSGCQEMVEMLNYPWNLNSPEAGLTFPLTAEWQRFHLSFVTAPDPDPDYLKPVRPRNPDVQEIQLMFVMNAAVGYIRLAPKSAFKVVMEGEDLQGNDVPVWVDAMQLEEGPLTPYRPAAVNTAGVVLERSDTNDFIYYEDQPLKITGKVFTENTQPRSLTLTYRITDFFGREVKKIERRVDTQGRNNIDDRFELLSPVRGLQAVTLTISDPTGQAEPSTSQQQAFGVFSALPRNWPFDEKAGYGMQASFRRVFEPTNAHWAEQCDRLRKIGVKWFLGYDIFSWFFTEPEKGKWRWDDATLAHLAYQDFMLPGHFRSVPGWLGGRPGNVPIDLVKGHWPEWEEYVYQVVNHYKDRIRYWEVWSEADYNPDIYARLVKTASSAARRADPSAKIIGLGITHAGNASLVDHSPDSQSSSYKEFVEGVLDKAGPDSMDAVSVHGYLGGLPEENWWPMSQRLEYLRGEMRKRGKVLPIWETESGVMSGLFYTDRVDGSDNYWNRKMGGRDQNVAVTSVQLDSRNAANWIAQTLAVYRAHGCEKFFYCAGWYWCGSMDDDDDSGVLYEYDSSPKSTYAAWAGIILMLDRSRFVREIGWGKDVRCYIYERDGIPTAAFWRLQVKENLPPGALTFNAPAGKLEFLDIMTNPLYGVKVKGKEISVPLTSDFCYIRGKGIGTAKFISILEKAKRSDPAQELIDWSLLFKPEVKANSAAAAAGKEIPVLDCRRVNRIQIDGKMEDWQSVKSFDIKGPEKLVVGRPDPSMPVGIQAGWRSDADLSAKLWLGWDQDNFYWAVLVRDDVVAENRYRGKPEAYLGDCVEVFFDARERAKQSSPVYDDLVGQILVTPATKENSQATITRLKPNNILSEMQAASKLTGDGYFVEGRIPVRKLIPEGLVKDQVVGFDLAIDDTDNPAENFKSHLSWTGIPNAHRDATVFGRLRLVD